MDVQVNSISSVSICEGCLSVDRKLSPILDVESRTFFLDTLHPLVNESHPLYLCWECKALIHRVLKFKKRIKYAHDCLVKYMHHQTTEITTLSHIKRHQITQEQNIFENNSNISFDSLKTDSYFEGAADVVSGSTKVFTVSHKKTGTDAVLNNETKHEPVYFIKIENNHCDDGLYIPDETQDDPTDDETLLKSDQNKDAQCTKKSKANTITKTKKKVDTQEGFNESDDEPLQLNKKKKERPEGEEKPRRKRKKTDSTGPRKVTRREQPPGVVRNSRVEKKLRELNLSGDQVEQIVLSWEEIETERKTALQSKAYTSLQYQCSDCVLGFNHSSKLEAHMAKHSPSAGEFSCKVCTVRSRDAHSLSSHMRRHRVRWRCVACGEVWSRAAVAADHVARAHGSAVPTHTCKICGHSEPTLGKLRSHVKDHSERPKCELCGKTYRDRNSLRSHLIIHKGNKEYACPKCDKKFLFKKAMEVHLVTHDASQHLYCYKCNVNFKNQMSYYQHLRYNLKHIDPAKLKYACEQCDKRFAKVSRLREHHVAVHLKETPIQCTFSECNFACASRPVLRTHIRMVHKNARAVRNHVCHTCGKAYTAKKILEGHLRSHTGERPFNCALCPAAFGYQAALYNHNRLVHQKPKVGRNRPPAPIAPADNVPPTAIAPAGNAGPTAVAPETSSWAQVQPPKALSTVVTS